MRGLYSTSRTVVNVFALNARAYFYLCAHTKQNAKECDARR